jgi:hypothetical protein
MPEGEAPKEDGRVHQAAALERSEPSGSGIGQNRMNRRIRTRMPGDMGYGKAVRPSHIPIENLSLDSADAKEQLRHHLFFETAV